jgi:hypothetical protein
MVRLSVFLAVALLAAGCGASSLSEKSLQKSAEAVQSSAAEAALVADDAADGRTTSAFVSVHAPELAKAASTQAKSLRSANGPADLKRKADELAKVADRVSKLADEIDGASEADAKRLADELRTEAEKAKELAG